MSLTTLSSTAAVIAFPPPAPIGRFERWREHWHRQVLADRELGHRDKSVAGILLWYLNRDERACFPSYETIAKGVGITPRDAIRSIANLIARGHLQRQRRVRKTNYYLPRTVAPCHGGGGTLPPPDSGKLDTLTSDYRTSDKNLGKDLGFEGREERGLARGQEALSKQERTLSEDELASLDRLRRLNGGAP